jgi:hypothetical protein
MGLWRDKIRRMFKSPSVYYPEDAEDDNEEEDDEEEDDEEEDEEVTCSKGLFFCCLNCCTCEGCSCSVDVGFKGSMI